MMLGTELCPCLADPVQLEQAVLNLVNNVRDAIDSGGRLILETENAEILVKDRILPEDMKPGGYVVISVTDTGEGMTADLVERIFEPFFMTKDVGKGTGLGLSMVFGFAKQSEGHIAVYSEPSLGYDHAALPAAGGRKLDPIALDHLLVESHAEAGAVREHQPAIARPRGVEVEAVPDGIALGIRETFDADGVRRRGQEMQGDLRLLVMGHANVSQAAESGGVEPGGDPAGLGRIEVHDVDGAGVDQAAHAMRADLALSSIDRDGGGGTDVGHGADVVEPMTRLFEPGDVQRFDSSREADRLPPVPGPVGVDGQHEAGAGRLTAYRDAFGVRFRREAADLDLAATHVAGLQHLHLGTEIVEGLARLVVAADRRDRQRSGRPAEQLRHRHTQQAPVRVPDRGIETGDRLQQVLGRHRRAGHEVPHPLVEPAPVANIFADDKRGENVVHQARDLCSMVAIVPIIDLRPGAVGELQAGDDGAAGGHRIDATAEGAR